MSKKFFPTLLLLLACSLFSVTNAATEKKGIQFFEGSWNEVLAESERTGKPIFVDAYAVWCGPCKWMSSKVFTDAEVGAFFNENFINYKYDMEKGEGKAFSRAYAVTAYPTLLFMNAEGRVEHRVVGYREPQPFIEEGKKALNEMGVAFKATAVDIAAGEKASINFFEGSWDEALAESERTGKPIFVDAYAVWCGPCKWMNKNVFSDAEVALFYNQNFVNYKFDMEKGEGPAFRRKYAISGYPTLLYLDSKGTVKHRVLGGRDVNSFIADGKAALQKFKADL